MKDSFLVVGIFSTKKAAIAAIEAKEEGDREGPLKRAGSYLIEEYNEQTHILRKKVEKKEYPCYDFT